MAKAVTTTKEASSGAKSTTVAKKVPVNVALSEEMLHLMQQDSGKGVSTAAEDNTVPLIYILQALSPQAQKKNEAYIDDAEAGMIWFRGSTDVVPGEDGISVIPCFFSKAWIEWKPDRGGFVARHPDKTADAEFVTDPQNPKRQFWRRRNGNILVETREHVVLVLDVYDRPTPFVVPMSGSNHKASRDWMTMMNNKVIPGTDAKAPSYGFIYRMTLKYMSNDQGDWYAWQVADEGDQPTLVSDPATYKLAHKINSDFSQGVLKAENADAHDAEMSEVI
jgi:hypothetical protein